MPPAEIPSVVSAWGSTVGNPFHMLGIARKGPFDAEAERELKAKCEERLRLYDEYTFIDAVRASNGPFSTYASDEELAVIARVLRRQCTTAYHLAMTPEVRAKLSGLRKDAALSEFSGELFVIPPFGAQCPKCIVSGSPLNAGLAVEKCRKCQTHYITGEVIRNSAGVDNTFMPIGASKTIPPAFLMFAASRDAAPAPPPKKRAAAAEADCEALARPGAVKESDLRDSRTVKAALAARRVKAPEAGESLRALRRLLLRECHARGEDVGAFRSRFADLVEEIEAELAPAPTRGGGGGEEGPSTPLQAPQQAPAAEPDPEIARDVLNATLVNAPRLRASYGTATFFTRAFDLYDAFLRRHLPELASKYRPTDKESALALIVLVARREGWKPHEHTYAILPKIWAGLRLADSTLHEWIRAGAARGPTQASPPSPPPESLVERRARRRPETEGLAVEVEERSPAAQLPPPKRQRGRPHGIAPTEGGSEGGGAAGRIVSRDGIEVEQRILDVLQGAEGGLSDAFFRSSWYKDITAVFSATMMGVRTKIGRRMYE